MQVYNILFNNNAYIVKKNMIQRIQTLYILIGGLFIISGFFVFPYTICDAGARNIYFFHQELGVLFLFLFAFFSLMSILTFRNRQKQLYCIAANIITLLCLIILVFLSHFFVGDLINIPSCSINYLFISDLCVGLLFFLLARRAIWKDENLVNSINRLR